MNVCQYSSKQDLAGWLQANVVLPVVEHQLERACLAFASPILSMEHWGYRHRANPVVNVCLGDSMSTNQTRLNPDHCRWFKSKP